MAEDARVRKTKQKLSAALVGLLLEGDFEDVSPAKLCEHAGINRSTFYRNYKSISQLKEEVENRILSGVKWPVKLTNGAADRREIAEQLNYIKEHRDLFMALSSKSFREDIFDKIRERAIALAKETYPEFQTLQQTYDYDNLTVYAISGVVGTVATWFMTGMAQDVESLGDFLASRITDTVIRLNKV